MNLKRRNLLKLLPFTGAIPFFGFKENTNPPDTDCLTTSDIQGPFYIPNAPATAELAPVGVPGEVCFITGTVYYNDCTTPIVNAEVDVWHANDAGGYEDDHYRGKVWTDEGGNYSFRTILPGKYLNGSQFRPRHFHYKVSKDGIGELTTQIYFEGDTSIPIDPWASQDSALDRTIPLTMDDFENLHGVADIVLDMAPPIINSTEDQGGIEQPTKTHIRSIFPNPVNAIGKIEIDVKRSAEITLECYSLSGKSIQKVIDKKRLPEGVQNFDFSSNTDLGLKIPTGIYILRLSENNIPIDTKRFIMI